jgi:hypothetical protein
LFYKMYGMGGMGGMSSYGGYGGSYGGMGSYGSSYGSGMGSSYGGYGSSSYGNRYGSRLKYVGSEALKATDKTAENKGENADPNNPNEQPAAERQKQ